MKKAQLARVEDHRGTPRLGPRGWAPGTPAHGGPWQAESPPRAGRRGWGARVLPQHVSWFPANSSRLPHAGDCHEFQPQTFPQQPQRKHPVQEPRQGLHVALGCQAAVSGPRGWPGAASSVWFSPSCPGTSDARLAVEAPRSWERHKGPTQLAWESPSRGKGCRRPRTPRPHHARARASPPQHGRSSRPLLAPELFRCSFRACIPRWDRQTDPDLIRGNTCPGGHARSQAPCAPRATRDQPGHTCAHACTRIPSVLSPEQPWHLGPVSRKSCPTSPVGWLSINQPHVRPWVDNGLGDTLTWVGLSELDPGRDQTRSDWTR